MLWPCKTGCILKIALSSRSNYFGKTMLKLANAPCSWGIIENTAGDRGAGYQQVLDEIHETGYRGTELGDWGFMPTDPTQLREALARRSLELVGSWVSIRLYDAAYHQAGAEAAVRTATLMAEAAGEHCIIVIGDDHSTVPVRFEHTGRIKPHHSLDSEGWKIYTDGAQKVARGMTTIEEVLKVAPPRYDH